MILRVRHSSLIGLAVWCCATVANAQTATGPATVVDTVILAPQADGAGRIVVTGRVIDYTSTALVLEASGQKQTIPGKQVVEVRSTWTAEQTAGDDLWRRRDYAAAQAKYAAALSTEQRPWVQHRVRSKLVAVLREQDRWELAAEEFLRLVTADPQTPYFAVIPLPWTATAPSPALEAKARNWATAGSSSAAALLGASFLLSSADRTSALKRLRELALDGDIRIAVLAEAQLWRNAAVTADANMVEGWERTLDKLPEPLRAGPALVVGRAWAQRNEPERAALLLLRVPILHDDQHRLAAEALWSGGQMLERMSQTAEAATLYRELVRDFPKSQVAGPAGERIKELAVKP
jgi:tetratricopeptide (TPR) repeat protein